MSSKSAKLMASAPLPVKNGVAPSRVYLQPGPWPTLYDFLVQRFQYTDPKVIYERLIRGEIVDEQGKRQTADAPYQPRRWLWYYRDVPPETPVPFQLQVLHRDEKLLVIDKPHFLASIPGGRYLRETALTRLRHELALPDLSPLHRLDRETAGVMMLCIDPACRGAYQQLFQNREVSKVYEAVAGYSDQLSFPLIRRSRLETRSWHFTMDEVEGEPNSETRVELIERKGTLGWYRLLPHTGRKHQLRVHMAGLGIPIVNDLFYPALAPQPAYHDYSKPLQLLARRIQFQDPFTGETRAFESQLQLEWTSRFDTASV
ncbi:pseudouridine synthase [Neopusillimonas maritima]|jgi:tRNA pseudouridine32 synthase/23S rRNA pseudouridine746 synthase|nr:pseudouridine synthase [Neopusillimonas maritima]